MSAWQFQGSCYPTPLAANEAAAAASSGVVSGGVVASATSVTDTAITFDVVDLQTGATHQRIVSVIPQPCNLLGAEEAVEIGWLLLGVFGAVYAVRYLAFIVDRHLNGSKNDA